MKSIKDYNRQVCTAVKNDPLGFIDILLAASVDEHNNGINELLLLEAACVIASLMERLGIPDVNKM